MKGRGASQQAANPSQGVRRRCGAGTVVAVTDGKNAHAYDRGSYPRRLLGGNLLVWLYDASSKPGYGWDVHEIGPDFPEYAQWLATVEALEAPRIWAIHSQVEPGRYAIWDGEHLTTDPKRNLVLRVGRGASRCRT